MSEPISWPKVILYGDSITQYSYSHDGQWGALLADHLQRKCDVINRGFSGYNTRWNKIMLPRLFSRDNTQNTVAFVLFLGANDSVLKEINPRQHVPLEEYSINLMEIIKYMESIGVSREKIIVIGPPPCDDKKYQEHCKTQGKVMSKCNETTEQYAAACELVAKEARVDHINLHQAMSKQENWSRFLNDGLHLSAEGSRLLFSLIKPLIDERTQHLLPIMPLWSEVEHENPQKSLL